MMISERVKSLVETIKKGPAALAALEHNLKLLSFEEREKLARYVVWANLPCPQIVLFDYDRQQWLVD